MRDFCFFDELGLSFFHHGPLVKWYYTAFALRRRGFDSPKVHIANRPGCNKRPV